MTISAQETLSIPIAGASFPLRLSLSGYGALLHPLINRQGYFLKVTYAHQERLQQEDSLSEHQG